MMTSEGGVVVGGVERGSSSLVAKLEPMTFSVLFNGRIGGATSGLM